MRQELSDITVILDRSGSMHVCQKEMEEGLNRYIDEQKKQPGEAVFTLVQFDTYYECIHRCIPIQNVPHCTLEPRGNTALLDAVGRTIYATGERLRNTLEEERPGLVVIVIITDGYENASQEFVSRDVIKRMIKHQQERYNWQFTFLGANQDAFAEAASIGIMPIATANFTVENSTETFMAAAGNTSRMRHATQSGGAVSSSYTDDERDSMSK